MAEGCFVRISNLESPIKLLTKLTLRTRDDTELKKLKMRLRKQIISCNNPYSRVIGPLKR